MKSNRARLPGNLGRLRTLPSTSPRRLGLTALALLGALSCGVALPSTEWQDPSTSPLLTGPYVMLGGPNRALVAFRIRQPRDDCVVRWRVEGSSEPPTVVGAKTEADLYYAELTGLPRGPRIAYTVAAGGVELDSGSFRVGTAPDQKSFRFVAFGDTRTGHAVHRSVVEAISREEIDFVVHTGDMVERGGIKEQWDWFFQIERPLLRRAPVLPAVGNHDASGRDYFERYFLHNEWTRGRRYFATDWGNLRLIAIDGGIECRSGCEQYTFAEQALASGAAAGKLMVMFLHYPPYSSGNHGSHLGVREPIAALSRRYGVELVLSGHDHNYERTLPIDGTTYVVSGSAGAPIRPVRPQSFTASARTEPHYVLVDVDGDRMTLRAINLAGEVFDSQVILPNPPRP